MNENYKHVIIQARDLPDLWFQAVNAILDKGRKFHIDRGSFAGQERLEFDYFTGIVNQPWFGSGTRQILPDIPAHLNIPAPVEFEYVYGGEGYPRSYVEYIMTPTLQSGESYTYGSRLTKAEISGTHRLWWDKGNPDIIDKRNIDGVILFEEDGKLYLNQVEWVIDTYRKYGHRNNQMVLQVAQPSDLMLIDPPCLRSICTRIQDNKLHFIIYYRSWDLFSGMPANLAGIEALHQYMAGEIGVEQGHFIVESKGLHLYGYTEEIAKLRTLKER